MSEWSTESRPKLDRKSVERAADSNLYNLID